MTLKFSIKSDDASMRKKLDDLARRQLPFAAAVAVTKTAVKVRDTSITQEYSRTFEVRNKGFIKSVHRVYGASASYAKRNGIAIASIQPVDDPPPMGTTANAGRGQGTKRTRAGTQFMKRHSRGGIKLPSRSKIAVPIKGSGITRRAGGPKAGKVNAAYLPRALLQKDGKYFRGVSKRTGKSFIGKVVGGKRNRKVKVMYSLETSVQIKKTYNPVPAARRGVASHFPRIFRGAFITALRTAKLR